MQSYARPSLPWLTHQPFLNTVPQHHPIALAASSLAPGRVGCAPPAVGGPVDRATLHHHVKTTSWRNE